jgi:hypothetical protein
MHKKLTEKVRLLLELTIRQRQERERLLLEAWLRRN